MTEKLSISVSSLTAELIDMGKPPQMTRSEWVETLIRKGLAGTSKGPIVQPGYNSRLFSDFSLRCEA